MTIIVTNTGYSFTQPTPATTWTIDHNLGHYPVVDTHVTINGQVNTVLPLNVQHTSLTQTVITFSTAQSGTARLV